MTASRLYLFDDARARAWEPFSLTRPVGELRFGCLLLRERAEETWNLPCSGHVAATGLAGFEEPGAPGVASPDSLEPDSHRVLVSSRAVVDAVPPSFLGSASALTLDGRVVGWILPPGTPGPEPEDVLHPDDADLGLPRVAIRGTLLDEPWTLVAFNGARIAADVGLLDASPLAMPHGVWILGDGGVFGRSGAAVEPGTVLDTREGPVVLDRDARIQGPARVTGPFYLGADSVVFGGTVENTAVGPRCKVRGEIADSVLTGFCNKAHDGYLGHALLGRWVNLGAFTTNSDLKNTYGPVRVERSVGTTDTGMLKVGVFLGDHVRTGIGTLLNTGTVVGAGSNLFGGAMPPVFVPPFSWGAGGELAEYRLDRFLQTAARVMERRDQTLSDGMAALWTHAFEATRTLRHERGVLP